MASERWRDLDPVPRDGDERSMLVPLLDWYRDGVIAKVEGLTDEQAKVRHVGSPSTIIGLVKHLALVEDNWFVHRFIGHALPEPWRSGDWCADRDWEFSSARDDSLEDVVTLYKTALERSRAIIAEASLDELAANEREGRGPFTMRWLLLHMLEETARHLGHLDILRELTDGATGE